MSGPPKARDVACPNCDAMALAVIPAGNEVVHSEEESDGKVWANCRSCDDQFLVFYREQTEDATE